MRAYTNRSETTNQGPAQTTDAGGRCMRARVRRRLSAFRDRQLHAINKAVTVFLETGDWHAASAVLVAAALRQTASEYGFSGVVVEGPTLRILAHEGIAWDGNRNRAFYDKALRTSEGVGYLEFTSFDNLFGAVITTGEAVLSNAPATDPRSGGRPDGHPPLHNFLGVPMLKGAEVIGMIGVANCSTGYTHVERSTLQVLARMAGVLYDGYRRLDREVELEERYRRLVESCPDAIAVHSGGEIVFVNPAGLRLARAERPEEVLGRPILDFVHPDCCQQVVRRLERLQSGQPVPLVAEKFVRLDGSTVDVEAEAIPFTYRGRPAVQVVIRDLTERKRGEKLQAALFQISEATSSVQDMTAFYATMHSIVGQLMYAGNFYVALHDEGTGLLSFPYFVDEMDSPPDPIPPGQTLTGYVLRTGEPLLASPDVFADLVNRGEVQSIGAASEDWLGVPLKEGTRAFGVLAVQSYGEGRRFSDAEKELLTFVSQQVATAITRKRAEEALRRSEQRYHSLAVLSPVGLFQTDSAGRCLYVNERWCEMTGLDTQTAMREGWAGALHPQDRERVFDEWRRAAEAGRGFKSEYRFRRPDGAVTWVLGHSAAQRDPAGHVIGHVGTITDVTERKGLEEQLRQSQKIEAVGQLAGGVAHDFNNLLSVITGYGELLVRGLEPQDPLQRKAQQVLQAAQRAAGLTQQLLAFSRKQVLAPKILDLNLVVADMEEMLKRLIREDITLKPSLAPALGAVKVDPAQIEQVIVNLAVNARDAMPEGGTLTIETRSVHLDHAYARSHPGASTGPHVLLAVADTGNGMDGETLARIFEPFFTTKAAGKGTGLGLSTVYGIVKQSNGYISVESEPGSGTRFEIYLPQVETIEGAIRASDARPAAAPGSETILLVEDAEAVREVSRDLLEAEGYKVLAAGDGPEALLIAREHAGPIHLMMTDLIMPQMSGRELAKHFGLVRPSAKILYVSGYTDDAVIRHDVHESQVAFLSKPFGSEALCRKIRTILDAPAIRPEEARTERLVHVGVSAAAGASGPADGWA